MSLLLALTGSSSPTNYEITADAGSYSLTGQAATILRGKLVSAVSGVYSLAGQSATILKSKAITAESGVYSLSGQNATIAYSGQVTPVVNTLHAGRKGYIIKGRRYWLNERELALLVSKMLEEIKRNDIKVDDPVKPKNISRRSWAEVKRTLQVIEASLSVEAEPIIRKLELEVVDEDEDEEVLLTLY